MQDKFVGDIGDYVKYALLRAIWGDRRLGVAWYRHLDTPGNAGKRTEYLDDPEKWRHLDPCLFDALKGLIDDGTRSIQAVIDSEILGANSITDYSLCPLDFCPFPPLERAAWRDCWFASVKDGLEKSCLVFADPDNGFVLDKNFKPWREAGSCKNPSVRGQSPYSQPPRCNLPSQHKTKGRTSV